MTAAFWGLVLLAMGCVCFVISLLTEWRTNPVPPWQGGLTLLGFTCWIISEFLFHMPIH
jgi:hypothetical protein